MQEAELYTPAEAVLKIEEIHGKKIAISRLNQLRRAGKIHGRTIGYNTTVYTLEDIKNADLSLSRVGRKPKKKEAE